MNPWHELYASGRQARGQRCTAPSVSHFWSSSFKTIVVFATAPQIDAADAGEIVTPRRKGGRVAHISRQESASVVNVGRATTGGLPHVCAFRDLGSPTACGELAYRPPTFHHIQPKSAKMTLKPKQRAKREIGRAVFVPARSPRRIIIGPS